jgi:hypothetical protein
MKQNEEKSDEIIDELMPKETFEKRFSFITNDTLKKNIAIAFEYIVFLIDIAGKENHKQLIRSSLYKDATVYTGTIVEACLCHALFKYFSANKLQKTKVLTPEWKEEGQGLIHEFNKKKRIRYVIEHMNYEDIKDSSNFIEINRACLRGKILSKKEFDLAEEIRTARNKLHVSGLKEIDNSYSKEKLDEIFNKANKIIRKVEKKLSRI